MLGSLGLIGLLIGGCGGKTQVVPSLSASSATIPNPTNLTPQTTQPENSSDNDPFAAGKKVFAANGCARCHAGAAGGAMAAGGPMGGGPMGGGRPGMAKGPDLSNVGADAKHTTEWLIAHIRNPKAHKQNSRMPGFEGKISEEDLKALAEYLAGLKKEDGR